MEEVTLEDNIAKLKHKYKMSDELIDKILFSNSDSDYLHPINISTLLALIDGVDETERLCWIKENGEWKLYTTDALLKAVSCYFLF